MSDFEKSSRLDTSQKNVIINGFINCAFHKDKSVTNFCKSTQCLLPMCPVCVSIHSEQHRQDKTHGQFVSIQQVIQNISDMLFKANKALEDLSEQYTQDYWNKQKILQSCKRTLNQSKNKLIKQIQRKYQQIQYRICRKINQFQDNIHDRYKQMQSQIQYVYDSLNKQRVDFDMNNEKLLKNIIMFYSQKKQDKIKQWLMKFRLNVNQLKKQSIKVNCNQKLGDIVKSIDGKINVQMFIDEENQYLISTARELIGSNTKRKRGESPRQEKQNYGQITIRKENAKEQQNLDNINPKPINKGLAQPLQDKFLWSASKF